LHKVYLSGLCVTLSKSIYSDIATRAVYVHCKKIEKRRTAMPPKGQSGQQKGKKVEHDSNGENGKWNPSRVLWHQDKRTFPIRS